MADRALFYYQAPDTFDEAALAKFEKTHLGAVYTAVIEKLSAALEATAADVDAILKEICMENSWKMPQVGQPLRIALSGGTQAPGIGEIVETLGVEESIRRIQTGCAALANV